MYILKNYVHSTTELRTLAVVADPAGIEWEARHGLAVLDSSFSRTLAYLKAALVAIRDGNPDVGADWNDILRYFTQLAPCTYTT